MNLQEIQILFDIQWEIYKNRYKIKIYKIIIEIFIIDLLLYIFYLLFLNFWQINLYLILKLKINNKI